jgi:hypothetical protein
MQTRGVHKVKTKLNAIKTTKVPNPPHNKLIYT